MIHLHLHTSYSLWDGYGDIEEYKEFYETNEWFKNSAFALTEHNTLYSYIKFRREGFNCYAGVELSILNNLHHITLLAKNERGYTRLNELVTIPQRQRDFSVVFDENYKDDILYLTGCVKTYFNNEARRNEILQLIDRGFDIVVEAVIYPNFEHIFIPLIDFAVKNGLRYVLTNDVHFLKKEHWIYNDIINCINSKSKFNDANRFRYDTGVYFMNEDEFIEKCGLFGIDKKIVLDSFKNSENIVESLYNKIPEVADIYIEGYDGDFDSYIKANIYRNIENKYKKDFENEVNMIKSKKFDKVFVLTNEIVKLLRENKILTGYGRGSSAASLVAYVLGITHVHPKIYNLDITRFINEHRNDLPDIDIDVPSNKREYVEHLIKKKFGDNVTRLHTLNRFTSVSLSNALARIFDYNYEAKSVNHMEFIVENKLYEYVKALEGKPAFAGTHPAGLCFGNDIAKKFIHIDMDDAMYLNLVKIDFLGLSTMDVIQSYYEKEGINWIEKFDTLKMKDVELDIVNIGTAGIFQMEAESCSIVTNMVKPKNINETIHVLALSRAPTLANSAHIKYVKYQEPNILKDLFPETRGVMLYQEQLLELLRKYTFFSSEKVEKARKIISKLKVDEFENIMKDFSNDAKMHFNQLELATIINAIQNSAEYLFNKSHATAYAHLTYLTAYLKKIDYIGYITHYINCIDDDEKLIRIISEAKNKKVMIHLPKIVLSKLYSKVDDKAIRIGDEIYLTDKVIKFRAKVDVMKIFKEYIEKMIEYKKTFGFYPFRIHNDIKTYSKRFIYCPLNHNVNGSFVSLCYVVSYNPHSKTALITDGYTVKKCYVFDDRTGEVLRNSEKTKNTVIVKIERKYGYKDTILKAKTLNEEE